MSEEIGIMKCIEIILPYIKASNLSAAMFINALTMMSDFKPVVFPFDGVSVGPAYACFSLESEVSKEFSTYLDRLVHEAEGFDPLRNVKIPEGASIEDAVKAIVDGFIEEIKRFGYNDIASVFENERKEFMRRIMKFTRCKNCDPETYFEKYFRLIRIVKVRYVIDRLAKKYLVIGDISKGIFLALLNASKVGFYELPNDGVKFMQLIASLFPDTYRIKYGVDPRGYAYYVKILMRIKDDVDTVYYLMNTLIKYTLGMSLDDLLMCIPENMRDEAKSMFRTDDVLFLSSVISGIASIDYGYTILIIPYTNSTMYVEQPKTKVSFEIGRFALCMYILTNLMARNVIK